MKKLRKDIRRYTGAAVTLGVGTMAIASTGHGATILPAFATTARLMRPVGTAMMGMHTIRLLGKYPRKMRRR